VAYVEDWLNKNKYKDFKANLGSGRTEQKTFNPKGKTDYSFLNSESALRPPTINEMMVDRIMRESTAHNCKNVTYKPKIRYGKNKTTINEKILNARMNAEILEEMIKERVEKMVTEKNKRSLAEKKHYGSNVLALSILNQEPIENKQNAYFSSDIESAGVELIAKFKNLSTTF
jgi:hypothetical protein